MTIDTASSTSALASSSFAVQRIGWSDARDADPSLLVSREWLVTNGLGGYASGTLGGVLTRRYHGLLIAALPAPLGRIVMLSHLSERLVLPDGSELRLGGEPVGDSLREEGLPFLKEFRLESGLPVWRFEAHGVVFERRILIPHRQNTVFVSYQLVSAAATVRLEVRPSMHFRPHEGPVNMPLKEPYQIASSDDRFEVHASDDLPPLRLFLYGEDGAFTVQGRRIKEVLYRTEESRGYESSGDLWSPGFFSAQLSTNAPVTLVASTESWEALLALPPEEAQTAELGRRQRLLDAAFDTVPTDVSAELVLAADQFIVTPSARVESAARARASGDEVRTVIAGYHWFTDWGRDTMISLEGLTLTTGRSIEAGYILRTFALAVKNGLIPNLFPEGDNEGLYHTADATLWFFHAIDRYVQTTGDRQTLRLLLPTLLDIVQHHLKGTLFGIRIDPEDDLFTQGAPGYQLTWMDAKVDDWVVTPRRGKAVELSALWYNALRLLARWVIEEDFPEGKRIAGDLSDHATRTSASFNRRFWYPEGSYLYDVVDGEHGDDPACRPNQILAMSLAHPVLDEERWPGVLDVVAKRLLTPVGLRSLSPDHPDYKAQYYGDLRARDAAYHQGTVWGWLIGPFVDAWLRVHPDDRRGARRFLAGFEPHLGEACIGSISEIFDANDPYTPRGCIAQAWSVAEVLRCWAKTAD